MNELQLYEDYTLRKPISQFTAERHEVGTLLTKDYYLWNSSNDWPVDNIRFENGDKDLKIIHPTRIDAGGVAKVTIEFRPPINRRKKLEEPTIYEGVLLIG